MKAKVLRDKLLRFQISPSARLTRAFFLLWIVTLYPQASVAVESWKWTTAIPESQGMSSQKLDALKDSLASNHSTALLVIRNDRIVYEWYGSGQSVTKGHYTASMAKALVGAVSLAVTASDGRIRLDHKVAKFVPQWKNDPFKSAITIRQLGSHTSGLEDAEINDLPHDQLPGWKGSFWKRMDRPD